MPKREVRVQINVPETVKRLVAERDRYRGLLIEALSIAENATSHAANAGNDRLSADYKAAGDRIRAALFPAITDAQEGTTP